MYQNTTSLTFLAFLALFVLCTGAVLQHILHPLRDIPGPFSARFTRLWYLRKVRKGTAAKDLIRLHVKYGKIVRVAPNQYSLDDPEAAKAIYGRTSSFRKSDFYTAFELPHIPNVFTMRPIDAHVQTRKKYHIAYSMSAMTAYEGYVDECINVFMQRLHVIAESGRSVNMSEWLQFFAFDVIGCITGSERFGFLDKGADHDALIQNIQDNFTYGSQMGIYPELHIPIFKAMGFLAKIGLININARTYLRGWVTDLAQKRTKLHGRKSEPLEPDSKAEQGPKDFATKFAEYHGNDPERFTYTDMLNGLSGNINAGSDTTSASLSSVVYHLFRHPRTLQKLREELEQHRQDGSVSSPRTFKECQHLDYLNAVIKESMRLIPAVGMPLVRVVPEGGAHICDRYFPQETLVGIHPWVAHRNTAVFGSDAAEFRPERWLKSESDESTLVEMEHYFLSWGAGSRTCLGRNVALLEMMKVVPEIVRHFDFEMGQELREAGELVTDAKFLVKPKNLWMRVRVHD